MCLSPDQWAKPSNHTPPLPSMATQPPLSTTTNLLVQTHIPQPSFRPFFLNVPTCAPFSCQLQIFHSTDYSYRPDQSVNAIKVHSVYQLGPGPTSPHQIHIWHVS